MYARCSLRLFFSLYSPSSPCSFFLDPFISQFGLLPFSGLGFYLISLSYLLHPILSETSRTPNFSTAFCLCIALGDTTSLRGESRVPRVAPPIDRPTVRPLAGS
ncbi:hypothetical protein BCR43DRAFT_484487 [Syncephalastrum racemosum]|uniref:Uncharacterized protein n=1 Tax=Syncephalastrum racemosum TaxID=13706 RepID=A0A1X2HKT2_SYNRA|nr:hypothetical protein BCR43DRAFT_484487 [Syncephalastrum racemosum]